MFSVTNRQHWQDGKYLRQSYKAAASCHWNLLQHTVYVCWLLNVTSYILQVEKWHVDTRELKGARGHMTPPPLHLSNIRCKCFPFRSCRDKQKSAMNERTNEGFCVGCWNILNNSPMTEKNAVNPQHICLKFVSEIFKLTWNCVRDRICCSLCS